MNALMKHTIPGVLALVTGAAVLARQPPPPPPPPPGAPMEGAQASTSAPPAAVAHPKALGVMVRGQRAAAPGAALAPTNDSGARIQFDSTVYDFGKVMGGEQVKHTFYFTNTGVGDLVLNNVHPGCGCTVVGEWTRQARPGQWGAIPIVFNAPDSSFPVNRAITVTCNDSTKPRGVTLGLKGVVWKAVEFPSTLSLAIRPDVTFASATGRITNMLEQPMMLSAPESANPLLAAYLRTNVLGRDYTLEVSNSAPLPAGNTRGLVRIKTSLPKPEVLNVTVWARVQSPVNVAPQNIVLRRAPLATNQLVYVTIANNLTNPISLSEPSVDAEGVGLTVTEGNPGRYFTVALKFPAGFELPAGRAVAFTAKTTHPQFPLVRVPITQLPRQASRTAALARPAQAVSSPATMVPPPPRPGTSGQ